MSQVGWQHSGLIIFSGLAILVISLILYWFGNISNLLTMVTILSPIVALLLGIVGLNAFGRESLVKDDRFHSLNVWMALGLIVFSLSEVASGIIHFAGYSNDICFTVGLVQMPALLLWGLGVLGYLRSSNIAMGITNTDSILQFIITLTSIAGLAILVVVAVLNPLQILYTAISTPMIVGLSVILFALGSLMWTLRNGLISRPLTLLFLGVLLFFIRTIFWSFINYCPGTPFDYLTAIESYILIGAAILASSKLDEIFTPFGDLE
ncbi:MAG: hypothetical protein ACFFF9_08350 [Candidatus Thorarchaeota archaeon]